MGKTYYFKIKKILDQTQSSVSKNDALCKAKNFSP